MLVSQVAKEVGVSPDTIRYYARLGLLPEAGRTAGGHRWFDGRTLERIRFIQGAQWFGLRLDEIGDLLRISDEGLCPCQHTQSLLERKIAAVEQQRTQLDHVHTVLRQILEQSGKEGFNDEAMLQAAAHRAASCGCSGCQAPASDEQTRLEAQRRRIERQLAALD